MPPNTRTLKGQSYSTKRWANLAWPKGSKLSGFSIYAEKKTFSKFDNEHYLCYLNEQREEYSPESDARSGEVTEPVSAPVLGYAYTGDMVDGGTLIEAKEATYDEFVSGLIRTRYSASRVEAIQSNRMIALVNPEHERAAEFISEWDDFQSYREQCKEQADALING